MEALVILFHKIFDQHCHQNEIFDVIAVPIINSVLEGFNGTIFAYGQTGSGKTYTITGSPKNYSDRGIIPRSIQYVFSHSETICLKPTIYISYMEIYNETGYDLLATKQCNPAKTIEELPKIIILEDGKGEKHIRNLSILPVTTEQEAMRLLFLGDTNRTIAETPMNEYSSRSHCVFTVYVTYRNTSTHKVRYSKLHLVDLAGSERVHKSHTTGVALSEAKSINLSLHYLQQVILALSQAKTHVPYRNSMMTYMLRDSLTGNCLTSMVATLTLTKSNILESISTCKFAQRVLLVKTVPTINEVNDPQQEIEYLKNKIQDLENQLNSAFSSSSCCSSLSKNDQDHCETSIKKYLEGHTSELDLDPDMNKIKYCFSILKSEVDLHKKNFEHQILEIDKQKKELSELKDTLEKKKEEISNLKKIADNIPPYTPSLTSPIHQQAYYSENIYFKKHVPNEEELYNTFLKKSKIKKDLEYFKITIQKKISIAKIFAEAIEQYQQNITYIRDKLEKCENHQEKDPLLYELEQQQNMYKKTLEDLKHLKNETFHLEAGLKQTEAVALKKFKRWKIDNASIEKNDENSFDSHSSISVPRKLPLEPHLTLWKNYTDFKSIGNTNYQAFFINENVAATNIPDQTPPSYRYQYTNSCKNPGFTLVESPVNSWPCSFHSWKEMSNKLVVSNEIEESPFYCDCLRNRDAPHSLCTSIQECCKCCYQSDAEANQSDHTYCVDNHGDESELSTEEDSITSPKTKPHTQKTSHCTFKSPCVSAVHFIEESIINSDLTYEEQSSSSSSSNQLDKIYEENSDHKTKVANFFNEEDTAEFKEFMKTVTLSGDADIDEEIFKFYRSKFF